MLIVGVCLKNFLSVNWFIINSAKSVAVILNFNPLPFNVAFTFPVAGRWFTVVQRTIIHSSLLFLTDSSIRFLSSIITLNHFVNTGRMKFLYIRGRNFLLSPAPITLMTTRRLMHVFYISPMITLFAMETKFVGLPFPFPPIPNV